MPSIRQRLKKQTSTPKGIIILLSVLLGIAALVTGAVIYWNAYKKQIIRNELEKALRDKTKGLYIIKYDDLSLDEVNGNLTVKNLHMDYDSVKFAELEKKGEAPSTLLHIQVPSLSVSGVKTPKALIDKEIVGTKLRINSPLIEIKYTMVGKDSSGNVPTREVYQQILGNLDLIKLDTVEISNGIISTQNNKTKRKNIELVNTTVQLLDVAVDSAANADTTRLFFARSLNMQCGAIAWTSANGLYKYAVDSVNLQSDNHLVTVKSFEIQPQLGEDAFVKSLPTQDDRFDFSVRGIRINQVNFQQLLKENIMADSITIQSASFKIYRDLSIVRDKKNRVGTYPHQAVAKIPLPLEVKTMVLQNAFVEYKEKNPKTNKAGKVQFYNATAVIRNMTNRNDLIAKNNLMTVDINTRFMNIAPFHVLWTFYLKNPKGRFDVSGNLGGFDAKAISALAEPMGPARVEDGRINSVQFNLAGNDYSMNGQVKMLYDDLKIAVLEKDEDSKKLEKKKLVSFIANILVKNSNPAKKGKEPREIAVSNERNTNRSIFNLAWKTLFKGVKETVGINK